MKESPGIEVGEGLWGEIGLVERPILTLTSVTAMSTTLPTTIRASNVFQASAK